MAEAERKAATSIFWATVDLLAPRVFSRLGVSGPRCSTGVPRLTTLHDVPRVLGGLSWNTRGTLVEHSWNTSDPWGLYSSVGSAHKHSWNTRGTRQVDPDTVNPAHAWPFCGWSPVRIPIEHGFAFFQAVHRFESESCKKISKWSWVRIPVCAHF